MKPKLTFLPGELIFKQHYPGDHAYIVISGEVEIFKETPEGEECVALLDAGQMFGELAILDDKPRAASARALTEVTLQIMPL